MAHSFEAKRDRLVAALRDAGLTPDVPAGAYYILADASRVPGENSAQKARTLLARTGVASVAGSAFFRPGGGENLLRFCFAKKDDAIEDACARLRDLAVRADSFARPTPVGRWNSVKTPIADRRSFCQAQDLSLLHRENFDRALPSKVCEIS